MLLYLTDIYIYETPSTPHNTARLLSKGCDNTNIRKVRRGQTLENLTNGDEERKTNQKGVSRERREYRIALKGYECIQNWLNKTQITKERVWRGKRFDSKKFWVNDLI